MKCRYCKNEVTIKTGEEIYPEVEQFKTIRFIACSICNANVMCEQFSDEPAGIIAGKKLRELRASIFLVLNPMLQNKGKKAKVALLKGVQVASGTNTADVNYYREESCKRVFEFLLHLQKQMNGVH